MSKTFLEDVENGKEFLVKDGRVVRNLKELAQVIKEIPLEIFLHHVNEEKNDFADWIKQVIGDFVLANRIKRFRSRSSISRLIERRVLELIFL